ncbi:hypothetical protein [Streptomyces sp. NPDC056670]|uniref:hypothetical protein n=1 Tax=Streptomyces sp. NPDC056670 TaxID=3345904 RepID=UPI003684643F
MNAREDILAGLRAAPAVGDAPPEELLDACRAEVRAEIAADIRRAELPSFPPGERADLVAQTVRAVDVRIAEQGAEAPYAVAAEPLCWCGHVRQRHVDPPGTPVCMDCPGDDERSWRHPYTPEVAS